MIIVGITLVVVAGIAEHFKDLSEEGKLSGYWNKNHPPMIYQRGLWRKATIGDYFMTSGGDSLWWKVHWLQGGLWDNIPVWIRQYLAFRDGWHLLKFISLNSFAIAVVLLAELPWWWYIIIRSAFSLPETILREARKFI